MINIISYHSGVEGKTVHFYGNNGVCVFKYLVTPHDPQKIFCLAVLAINFFCFVVISVCYLVINVKTARSSEIVSRSNNPHQRKGIQAKISAIIFTDFMCWIPLTAICYLHYGGVINATDWYPVFSIVLLPINSVINPVLYNAKIGQVLCAPVRVLIRFGGRAVAYIQGERDESDVEQSELQMRRETKTDVVKRDHEPAGISQIVETENL